MSDVTHTPEEALPLIERIARAIALAADDGCFLRLDDNECGCDGEHWCSDAEDAAYWTSLARAAEQIIRDGSDR